MAFYINRKAPSYFSVFQLTFSNASQVESNIYDLFFLVQPAL